MSLGMRAALALVVICLSTGVGRTQSVSARTEPQAGDDRQTETSAAGASLHPALVSVINEPLFRHAHWGILLVDLGDGTVLQQHQPDKLFVPASTTKLFSVAAALDELGADYRFETVLHRRGDVDENGTFTGDLILRASGDLTMGGRTTPEGAIEFTDSDHIYAGFSTKTKLTAADPLAGLNELARRAYEAGIRVVTGEVLVDDRLFDHSSSSGSGPDKVTPIMINDNLVDFVVTPKQPGEPASVTWRPQCSAIRVDALVGTIKSGATSNITVRSTGEDRLVVRGVIAAECEPRIVVHEVSDPAAFCRSLLIEALTRAGVVLYASPLESNGRRRLPSAEEVAKLPQVAVLTSAPFAESAKLILKVSHNLHASTLPLLLAVKHGKRTISDGLRFEGEALGRIGVDYTTISFGGGAGGARADFVTPRAVVQLLTAMSKRPDFAAYKAALPILGVDGTLHDAVDAESPARGKAWAKTGTLVWTNLLTDGRGLLTSKALAGYVTTASGRQCAVALYVNNVHADVAVREQVGRTLGHIVEIIYEQF